MYVSKVEAVQVSKVCFGAQLKCSIRLWFGMHSSETIMSALNIKPWLVMKTEPTNYRVTTLLVDLNHIIGAKKDDLHLMVFSALL